MKNIYIYVCTYILPCYDVHTLLSRAEVMELEATITEGQNWSAVYYHTHTHFCHSHLWIDWIEGASSVKSYCYI